MSFVSGINALCTRLENYLTPDQIADIRRAYLYSEKAHDGQFRRNGDPYITHPLAVANILCDMHMDHQRVGWLAASWPPCCTT